MLSTDQIKEKAGRLWSKLLAAGARGEDLCPYRMPLAPPGSREIGDTFGQVHQWIKDIEKFSRRHRLEITWKTIHHRQLGTQRLPAQMVFPDRQRLLKTIGREKDYHRFAASLTLTQQELPELAECLPQIYRLIDRYADQWSQLIQVVKYFQKHPRPDKYLRELDIPEIDSKLIEVRISVLRSLLDICLPASAIRQECDSPGLAGFCRRYSLKYDPPLVRFRWLDASLAKHCLGLSDISVTLDEFIRTNPTVHTVFITENKINGLSFPAFDNAMVIFGLGYGIDMLAEVSWLQKKTVYYWGDIDTHGFHMLDRLRRFLPGTRSLLMDEETLLKCRKVWGFEPAEKRFSGKLHYLNDQENTLYLRLLSDFYRPGIRLEQERIPFCLVEDSLKEICQQ